MVINKLKLYSSLTPICPLRYKH